MFKSIFLLIILFSIIRCNLVERIKNIYKERDANEIHNNFHSILGSPELKRVEDLSSKKFHVIAFIQRLLK